MECHLHDADGVGDLELAVGLDSYDPPQLGSAGAHNELADPLGRVRLPARVLRGEAFVVVVMTVQHHVRTRLVESIPEGGHRGMVAMNAGTEAWMVPVGKRACVRVGGKIFPKPLLLRGSGGAASRHRRTVRVQRDHMPASQIVGVVALAIDHAPRFGRRCGIPKELEITWGARCLVLVVAWAGHGAILELAPPRIVAPGEVGRCAPWVGVVAEGSDRDTAVR